MFIIVSGTVRVMHAGDSRPHEIARRGPGDYVGEMSVISLEPRMASLVAEGDVRLLSLEHHTFEAILRERPEISLGLMRELCVRLRVAREAGSAHSS